MAAGRAGCTSTGASPSGGAGLQGRRAPTSTAWASAGACACVCVGVDVRWPLRSRPLRGPHPLVCSCVCSANQPCLCSYAARARPPPTRARPRQENPPHPPGPRRRRRRLRNTAASPPPERNVVTAETGLRDRAQAWEARGGAREMQELAAGAPSASSSVHRKVDMEALPALGVWRQRCRGGREPKQVQWRPKLEPLGRTGCHHPAHPGAASAPQTCHPFRRPCTAARCGLRSSPHASRCAGFGSACPERGSPDFACILHVTSLVEVVILLSQFTLGGLCTRLPLLGPLPGPLDKGLMA